MIFVFILFLIPL